MNCMQSKSVVLFASLLLGACGSNDGVSAVDAAPTPSIDAGLDAAVGPPTEFGGARPATLLVPPSYDKSTPMPLVVALHGYNKASSTYETGLLGLDPLYQTAGFLLIAPAGKKDSNDAFFWNATDACCNFDANPVDDVAYINGLVDEIVAAYNVDARRIYVVGHSNGGFMAYRLACTSASRFAAIISVAGATFEDVAACTPSARINVLQIHGTADNTIKYDGSSIKVQNVEHPYPSAAGSVQRWAAYNGCAATTTPGFALDLTSAAGAETDPVSYDACPAGGSVALWTVNGAPHLVLMSSGLPLWDWLVAHPKP